MEKGSLFILRNQGVYWTLVDVSMLLVLITPSHTQISISLLHPYIIIHVLHNFLYTIRLVLIRRICFTIKASEGDDDFS